MSRHVICLDMILVKKMTAEQVLQAISALAMESLPEGMQGDIHAEFDSEFGVEITFVRTDENRAQS